MIHLKMTLSVISFENMKNIQKHTENVMVKLFIQHSVYSKLMTSDLRDIFMFERM